MEKDGLEKLINRVIGCPRFSIEFAEEKINFESEKQMPRRCEKIE